jgi:hypothetical protein
VLFRSLPTFKADEAVLARLSHGQPLTAAQVPETAIQGSDRTDGPLKVVDGQGRLRAVLERAPGGETYNYCCVFS